MEINNDIRTLELLDVRITSLGCEFLKKAFMRPVIEGQTGVKFLRLDHNDIGDSGMKFLSEGLSMNDTLHTLSVSYCNLTEASAKYLRDILIYYKSKITNLNIQGNNLGNEGAKQLFHSLTINKTLEEINLSDNSINDNDQEVSEKFVNLISTNKTLGSFDLRYNQLYETWGNAVLNVLSGV